MTFSFYDLHVLECNDFYYHDKLNNTKVELVFNTTYCINGKGNMMYTFVPLVSHILGPRGHSYLGM